MQGERKLENVQIKILVGGIDKWVKSKNHKKTTQNLFNGPIKDVQKRSQLSRFRKTPSHLQKTDSVFLHLLAENMALGEKQLEE